MILPVSTEIRMKKIRCIFNYKISRVYAFHTLITDEVYTRLISQGSLQKKKSNATQHVHRAILIKIVIFISWDILGVSNLA